MTEPTRSEIIVLPAQDKLPTVPAIVADAGDNAARRFRGTEGDVLEWHELKPQSSCRKGFVTNSLVVFQDDSMGVKAETP